MDLFSNVAYASVDSFVANANRLIINPLIGLLFALAVAYFLYGVFDFLANQGNEEKKTSGKQHMMWGIIGVTIMVGVWTILSMILNTFGLSDQIQITDQREGRVQVDLNDYNPDLKLFK